MKMLLSLMMIFGSTFAMADGGDWKIKCYERSHQEMDLAYIIKVGHHDMEELNRSLTLLDCSEEQEAKGQCHKRGYLYPDQRQNESCLVLKHHGDGDADKMGSWSLCYEEQETLDGGLVPVTVTDDNQDGRIYCERSLLRIL